ncbi:MAG: hypothetical protein R2844_07720 [Caldilineales bacterium]
MTGLMEVRLAGLVNLDTGVRNNLVGLESLADLGIFIDRGGSLRIVEDKRNDLVRSG